MGMVPCSSSSFCLWGLWSKSLSGKWLLDVVGPSWDLSGDVGMDLVLAQVWPHCWHGAEGLHPFPLQEALFLLFFMGLHLLPFVRPHGVVGLSHSLREPWLTAGVPRDSTSSTEGGTKSCSALGWKCSQPCKANDSHADPCRARNISMTVCSGGEHLDKVALSLARVSPRKVRFLIITHLQEAPPIYRRCHQ